MSRGLLPIAGVPTSLLTRMLRGNVDFNLCLQIMVITNKCDGLSTFVRPTAGSK